MKTTIQNITAKASLLFLGLLSSVYAIAQDGSTSQTESNTTVSHSQSTAPAADATMWYMNPIVWVVGGVILLVIILLAVRSGSTSRSSSTTTTRDGGISRTTTTTVRED